MEDIHISSEELNGVHLHLYNTNKFKTVSIMLTMKSPLQESLITARALIPHILNGGSIHYPNRKLIQQKLDKLYGATLLLDVQKKVKIIALFLGWRYLRTNFLMILLHY